MLALGRSIKLGKQRVGKVKSGSGSRRKTSGESGAPGGRREGIGLRCTFRMERKRQMDILKGEKIGCGEGRTKGSRG